MPAGCKVICAAGESVVKQERCVSHLHTINTRSVEFIIIMIKKTLVSWCRYPFLLSLFDFHSQATKPTSSPLITLFKKPSSLSWTGTETGRDYFCKVATPFPSYQHEAILHFGKRMWLQQVKASAQMHWADGVCQLQIFVITKSQQSSVQLQFSSDSEVHSELQSSDVKRCNLIRRGPNLWISFTPLVFILTEKIIV